MVANSSSRTGNTERCLPAQDNFVYLDDLERILLESTFLGLLVVGVSINSLAVYLTYQTKQLKNRSLRLMWFLSMNDTVLSLISNISYFFLLEFYTNLSCTTKIIFNTSAQLFTHSSAYLVCFIGFDRFIRVRYLHDYDRVFTAYRFKTGLAIVYIVSIIQTLFTVIGPMSLGEGYGAILTTPLNSIIGCTTLTCYGISIWKLHQHSKQSRVISNSDRSLVKMASIHVIVVFCCYSPAVIYGLLYKPLNLSNSTLAIFTASLFILSSLHSSINAAVFIWKNQPNRQKLKQLLRKYGNRVGSSDNSQVIPSVYITEPPV